MEQFLRPTPVLDSNHPEVVTLARTLAQGSDDVAEIARRSFEWVRDEIRHSGDFDLAAVTCSASDVLRERSGFCYAKSHLLAALLRANSIPAGLCYQRLSIDDEGTAFCLHGLNAVHLPDVGWYRVDPRGNRDSIDAQFDPPFERLAFQPSSPGEYDMRGILADPLPVVIEALKAHTDARRLACALPDLAPTAGARSIE